jgi:hypothetical protein
MLVGQNIEVRGCVTQEKYVRGRTLVDLERILGFHTGRLAHGIVVARLNVLPQPDQFELAGYTQVASHRHREPTGLDIPKLKSLARAKWAAGGLERLVKVIPNTPHDNNLEPDYQYPPGEGVPQWVLTTKLPATVIGVVTGYPAARFQPSL